jgi:MYXO-CTERM domain-containing protein
LVGGGLPYRVIPEGPAQGLAALACLGLAAATIWRRQWR